MKYVHCTKQKLKLVFKYIFQDVNNKAPQFRNSSYNATISECDGIGMPILRFEFLFTAKDNIVLQSIFKGNSCTCGA